MIRGNLSLLADIFGCNAFWSNFLIGSLYPEEALMLRQMTLSPSYQSELSDCSFYPPTHSSASRPPYFSPYDEPIPEETLSTSLDLLLPG